MKSILITLEDKEFEEAQAKKGQMSWKELFLNSLGIIKQ